MFLFLFVVVAVFVVVVDVVVVVEFISADHEAVGLMPLVPRPPATPMMHHQDHDYEYKSAITITHNKVATSTITAAASTTTYHTKIIPTTTTTAASLYLYHDRLLYLGMN